MKEKQEKLILEYLGEHQFASVEKLAEILFVSPSTVRRSLNELQAKGLVSRTHGGVKINDENNFAPSFTFRFHQNSFEKKKIALSAMKLIKNGDLIFLDGTTSAFFIAEYLAEFKNLRVITNGIDTLSLLSRAGVCAYSTGGMVEEENRSVLIGRYAEETICNFHADIVFFSAQSVDSSGEIYDCFEEENFIRKAMIKNAKKKVFLCDSTKFNKTSSYHLCSLADCDYIVSNEPLPENIPLGKAQAIIPE